MLVHKLVSTIHSGNGRIFGYQNCYHSICRNFFQFSAEFHSNQKGCVRECFISAQFGWCCPVQPRSQAPLLRFGNWAVIDAAGEWANHNTKKIQHKAREIDCEQGERLSFFNCLWLAESLRMRLSSLKPILNQEIYFRRASETVIIIITT